MKAPKLVAILLLPLALVVGACANFDPGTPPVLGRFVLHFQNAKIPGLTEEKLRRAFAKHPPRPGSDISLNGKRIQLFRTADRGTGITIAQQAVAEEKPTPPPSGEGAAVHMTQRVVYDDLNSLEGFLDALQ
jgi:hypothetical protein